MPAWVTKRESVLQAIAECDRLGRATFLEKYGYHEHQSYAIIHEGRRDDSKAIYGVAAKFEGGRPLRASEFSGGKAAAAKWLRDDRRTQPGKYDRLPACRQSWLGRPAREVSRSASPSPACGATDA